MLSYTMIKAVVVIFLLLMGVGMMMLAPSVPYYLSQYAIVVGAMGFVFMVLGLIAIFKLRD
jgi:hypothetical protein